MSHNVSFPSSSVVRTWAKQICVIDYTYVIQRLRTQSESWDDRAAAAAAAVAQWCWPASVMPMISQHEHDTHLTAASYIDYADAADILSAVVAGSNSITLNAGGRVPVGRRAAPSPLSWRVSSRRRLVSALCAAAAVQSISTHRDCPQPSVLARWRFGRPTQWKHWELRRFGDCKSGTVLRRTEADGGRGVDIIWQKIYGTAVPYIFCPIGHKEIPFKRPLTQ